MSRREVTEFDLRAPEFQSRDVKPEDYEFREDGKVVRKDRWETGLRNVASAIGWTRKEWEIPEVVEEVKRKLREAETRHTNLLLDLGRLINGEEPLNGCSEVNQLRDMLVGNAGVEGSDS